MPPSPECVRTIPDACHGARSSVQGHARCSSAAPPAGACVGCGFTSSMREAAGEEAAGEDPPAAAACFFITFRLGIGGGGVDAPAAADACEGARDACGATLPPIACPRAENTEPTALCTLCTDGVGDPARPRAGMPGYQGTIPEPEAALAVSRRKPCAALPGSPLGIGEGVGAGMSCEKTELGAPNIPERSMTFISPGRIGVDGSGGGAICGCAAAEATVPGDLATPDAAVAPAEAGGETGSVAAAARSVEPRRCWALARSTPITCCGDLSCSCWPRVRGTPG